MKNLTYLLALTFTVGCTDLSFEENQDSQANTSDDAATVWPDGLSPCTDPQEDFDGDKIPNGQEGCLNNRDTDGDKVPDWQDSDSDGDKVPDQYEAGQKDSTGKCQGATPGKNNWPCDSDGDQLPDYLDKDSDGDGLQDGEEDGNGDGQLGCCLTKCNTPHSTWQTKNCKLVKSTPAQSTDGCGAGQKCTSGACLPLAHFNCSEGETSPKKKDTFGDGRLDNTRGTFICRDATEAKPLGRKPVVLKSDATGDWHIALEKAAKYGTLKIANAGAKMAAGIIDHDTAGEDVAGFIVSLDTKQAKVQDALTTILAGIQSGVPGGSGKVTVRSSGTQVRSHDLYDSVQGTFVDITLTSASDVSTARNELIAILLGKQMSDLSSLSGPFGSSSTGLVLRFTTIKRVEHKKGADGKVLTDASGTPIETGDQNKWRLIIMGAIAAKTNYESPKFKTGIILDDLSSGSAVAVAADKVGNECDVGTIDKLPQEDILWVVDTSGSMYNNQVDVANNASNFFSRALSAGLDFRMAVMPSCETQKICKGRFLQPSEQSLFSGCIKSPGSGSCETGLASAKAAVKALLPRTTLATNKIRTGVTLVIIEVTDELPQKAKSSVGYSLNKCTLDTATKAKLDTHIAQYKSFFTGMTDPEAVAVMHGIAGVCNNSCGAEIGHGYMELAQLTGGLMGDICQKNLGSTMQSIIDSITGAASPVVLDYVPISSSLAVALNATVVPRSRSNGFDYRSSANSLVFINVKYTKGAEIIASYKRWERQTLIK